MVDPSKASEKAATALSTDDLTRAAFKIFHVVDMHLMYASAASRDLLIVVFYGQTQTSAVLRLISQADTLARGNNRVVSIITIVRQDAPMPEKEARLALENGFSYLIKDGIDVQSAVVFEGSGAKASIVRSFVTALSLVARSVLPNKVFASIEDAAAWHGTRIKTIAPIDRPMLGAVAAELDRRRAALTVAAKSRA